MGRECHQNIVYLRSSLHNNLSTDDLGSSCINTTFLGISQQLTTIYNEL